MAEKHIDRRDFLKTLGAAGVAASGLSALSSCGSGSSVSQAGNAPLQKDAMTYRTFPELGDKVSLLGYGCMRWPTAKDENGKDYIVQDLVNELVDTAFEYGVNYFDVAPVYIQGMSEAATGVALARHPRESYFLATKMSNFTVYTYEASVRLYQQSLKNLQTDYIDYYLLHNIGVPGMFDKRFVENGVLDYLLKEREAGHIRHLGWSFHGVKEEFDYILSMHEKVHWDFVQIQLNYSDWRHASGNNVDAEYLYNELAKRNIPVTIMEPLQGGRLSKVPDHIAQRLQERNPYGSVASWAFRFAGSHEKVLTVLSGMTYMEHLKDNLSTFCPLVELTDEEKDFLYDTADLIAQYPTIPCNDCKYCMPCPYGIDIPAIFIHYNKCVNEGTMPQSSASENYRKARRAFLVGYDRAVPKLRQADHCISCSQCVPHCPQSIKIPAQMNKIHKFVENLKQGKEF